jgi:outer membrane protein OmpA-like peptidoglycan-associated protein
MCGPFIRVGFLIITTIGALGAQETGTRYPVSKRAAKTYAEAKQIYRSGDKDRAIASLEALIADEPTCTDAALTLADWYYRDGKITAAAGAFETIIATDSFYLPRTLYSLGKIYLRMGEFQRSRLLLQRFLEEGNPDKGLKTNAETHLEKARFAEELVSHPVHFDPVVLPGLVNTDDSESLPSFTVDGQYMFFTRMIRGQEDIYLSEWDSVSGEWAFPTSLTRINTRYNEGAQAVSADGSTLAFTACGRPDGAGSCDLYLWRRQGGVWQPPVNAGSINSRGWDSHPAITPDGRGIYFSSDRQGGLGGRDIWYTERREKGWTIPVNLGPPVNTPGNEESPFLYFDGRTLYFMSDGHPGLGSSDLFMSTRMENSWTEPKNLGYPINTHRKEGALSIHPNGRDAYYTSDRSGQNDIYRFALDTTLLPPAVSHLQGEVVNAINDEAVLADILIYDLEDSTEHYMYTTNDAGVFSAVLVHGRRYGIHVSADGYAFWSDQVYLDPADGYGIRKILIPLIPIREGQTEETPPIILRNVEFASGSAVLLSSSQPELSRLLHLLREHSTIRIEIRGHTDHVGSDEDNQLLSEARALAVYDYLVGQGVQERRLRYMGFGENKPVASNDTEVGRQANRRVEFVILSSVE